MEFCSTNGRLPPGFRFHPMDVELVMYYLKRKVLGKRLQPEVIVEVDIYLFHPRDLPEFARLKKDLNWYFFCPRGKKYGSGERTNRATQTGYWKATGNDRDVVYEGRTVGKIKTLIFHQGKAPKGDRTDWVMHEYRLEDKKLADEGVCQDSYVLCKIFKKSGLGPKNGEQYGAPFVEEEWDELEDDETTTCTEVLTFEAQNQCASAVTVNACPSSISEQVYSEKNFGANVASSSMVLVRNYDSSLDQGLPTLSFAPNWASSVKGFSPNYHNDPVAQGHGLMSNAAADIASTSSAPPPHFDDDEINRMLDSFECDGFRDIFDCLRDLDHNAAQGVNESAMTNSSGGGLDLTDLDAPL